MSRIGKQTIEIPSGVEVTKSPNSLKVKGPKGELSIDIHPHVKVNIENNIISVTVDNPDLKLDRALWGLFRSLIFNMVTGVVAGFEKKLEISGVGFKASVAGRKFVLNIGFSHPVELDIPDGVEVVVEKNTISVSGIDKQSVGQFASVIKSKKKPEPYKGKGIKYQGDIIRRKAGKAAKGAEK